MKPLKDLLPHEGQYIGTAVMPHLLDEAKYRETIEEEFNSVVVEHHMKWEPLCQRGENNYDFTESDKIVDWAKSNGMNVKGHTLIWHITSPSWLDEKSPQQLRESMRRHIYTTIGHFKDRVDSWDVVNEALAPDGSFANNIFYQKLGVNYIHESFRWARAADANCRLIYNDNKVEGHMTDGDVSNMGYNPYFCRKSDAMFKLVKDMLDVKVPLDEVGLQGHFTCSGVGLGKPPPPQAVQNNIKRYDDLGLQVNISELDVRVCKLPEHINRDDAQSELYRDIVNSSYTLPRFRGITFWGFTDKHTWIKEFYGQDTPLLWNTQYSRKPAYFAVAQGLQDAANPTDIVHDWSKWLQMDSSDCIATTSAGTAKPDWQAE